MSYYFSFLYPNRVPLILQIIIILNYLDLIKSILYVSEINEKQELFSIPQSQWSFSSFQKINAKNTILTDTTIYYTGR